MDRARWGGSYVRRLVKLAPEDSAEIERASASLLADLSSQEEGLEVYDKLITRLGDMLLEWSAADPERRKVVAALSSQMAARCATLPEDEAPPVACTNFAKAPDAETAPG
jgi:hypothetical protein